MIKTETEMLEQILSDDGYRIINSTAVALGDISIYRDKHNSNIHHTGIVAVVDSPLGYPTKDITLILSKWGEYGEYLHAPFDVPPSYGRNIEYWSNRK